MPLYIVSNEREFNEIIHERRLNIVVFTVCWSLGSKLVLPAIHDVSYDKNLTHINFYRVDVNEENLEFIQQLNIVTIPTIHWYYYGDRLYEFTGLDTEHFANKTRQLALIYKRKTDKQISRILLTSSADENAANESIGRNSR